MSAPLRGQLEAQLRALLARHGSPEAAERAPITEAVEQLELALAAASEDGRSLSRLEIARIRLGKFLASRLPPELYRDPPKLAALRAEIHAIARDWLHSTEARSESEA
jgi:hypothetical protein